MGSSSIRRTILEGITGSQGNVGPRGSIGDTGPSGLTGLTGPLGFYISSITYNSNHDPILILSNGVEFPILGLTGNTGETRTLGGASLSNKSNLFHSYSGTTVFIRGICFSGLLTPSIQNETIVVQANDETNEISVSGNSKPSKLSYAKTESVVDSTNIDIINSEILSFSNSNGITFRSTFIDSKFTVATIPSVEQENINSYLNSYQNISEYVSGIDETKGIYIDVTKSSLFVINTPIGIAGFSFSSALYDSNDIISFTMFVYGNEIWSFPNNVYFENTPESSYFGCGMNIMNLMTYNKGITWYATITDRGYGVTGCNDYDALGSCCYRDAEGNFECDDYRTKSACDRLNGLFRVATSCEQSCGTTLSTFCCTEGKCLDYISEDECESFGGKFYATDATVLVGTERVLLSCDMGNPSGNNYDTPILTGRLCYDRCADPVSCCKNGVCLGETSRIVCEMVLGGRAVPGVTCGTVDCCKEIGFYGACCGLSGSQRTCRDDYIYNCKIENDEVFMGHGTQCSNQNICCQTDIEYDGICCLFNQACVGTNRFVCNSLNGVFFEGAPFCNVCEECRDAEGNWVCPCPDGNDQNCGCANPPCEPNPCPNPPCGGCPNPPCGPCQGPNCPPPPPFGSTCISVGSRSYCFECDERNPCEGQCRADCGDVVPPGPERCTNPPCGPDPVIPPPPPPGGGGGGPPSEEEQTGCPTGCGASGAPEGQCSCPKFPINGWMFDQPADGIDPVTGEPSCICARTRRDPNVEKSLYPDGNGGYCPSYDDELEWENLDGTDGDVPSYLPACCTPPTSPLASCNPRLCYCSQVFREKLGLPYSWDEEGPLGCCGVPSCANPPGGCIQCNPILRTRSPGEDEGLGCVYTYRCKPPVVYCGCEPQQTSDPCNPDTVACAAVNCSEPGIITVCPGGCPGIRFTPPSSTSLLPPFMYLRDLTTGDCNWFSCLYEGSPCFDSMNFESCSEDEGES